MKQTMGTFARAALAVAILGIVLVPASARAETIRFDQIQQGGTLTSSGGDITGTQIIFEFITYDANDDGNVDGVAYCGTSFSVVGGTPTNCYLNFDTASNTFVLTTDTGAGLYDASFNLIAGTTDSIVLSGTFLSAAFDGTGTNFTATGLDTKNQALLDYFGVLTTNFAFNNTEIRTDSSGTVTQADIINTPVPEPGLLALFGLGLLGVGRKLAKSRS